MPHSPYTPVDPGKVIEIRLNDKLELRTLVSTIFHFSDVPENIVGNTVIVNCADNTFVSEEFMEEFIFRLHLSEVEEIFFRSYSNQLQRSVEAVLNTYRYRTPEQRKIRENIFSKITFVTQGITDLPPRTGIS